jgi:hypothetical protein
MTRSPLQLVVDNMTELEHTGTVHKQLAFGIEDFDTVETRCRHDDDSVTIFYQGRQRPLPAYLKLLMGFIPFRELKLACGNTLLQLFCPVLHDDDAPTGYAREVRRAFSSFTSTVYSGSTSWTMGVREFCATN